MNIYNKKIEKLLNKAKQDEAILAVMLFGSTARNETTSASDLDICLVITPSLKDFTSLEFSQKRIEYLKEFPFDVHIFQQFPLYLKHRVLGEGKTLYVRDEEALYKIAFRTAQSYEDFTHIYHSYLKEVLASG